MLTVTTYDPRVHGSPVCDGCGHPHLLPGNHLYVLDARLMISCGCVIDDSEGLTRVVCAALSVTDFALLISALCSEARLVAAVGSLREVTVARAPVTCGFCGYTLSRLIGDDGSDLCAFCAASLRGW